MSDYIVRAACADLKIRAFAISARDMVEYARIRHGSSPVITDALGRLLMGGAMMGIMMKGEKDILTIQMKGDGPAGDITVTADSHGNVKGYAQNSHVDIPANYAGKLDVGAAIGYGEMTVIKDLGLKEPYVSQIPLATSEVADDLTYYFAKSEQTPTSVGLGILLNPDGSVSDAEGFIIQVMPHAEDELIDELEKRIQGLSLTELMQKGLDPIGILQYILHDMGLEIIGRTDAAFKCNCSKDHVARVLISLGRAELEDIIKEGEPVTLNCSFCNSDYTYSIDEIKRMLMIAQIKEAAGKPEIKKSKK